MFVAGTPDNSLGNNGDAAIDTTNEILYHKVAGVWGEPIQLGGQVPPFDIGTAPFPSIGDLARVGGTTPYVDEPIVTTKTSRGEYSLISAREDELWLGAGLDDANSEDGIQEKRVSATGIQGDFFLDRSDVRQKQDNAGGQYEYEFYADNEAGLPSQFSWQTTTNTPAVIKNILGSLPSNLFFVELYIRAVGITNAAHKACWKFFGSTVDGADYMSTAYYRATSGAGSWDVAVSGPGHVTVTGPNGERVAWQLLGRVF
jgi:hypothetical protein